MFFPWGRCSKTERETKREGERGREQLQLKRLAKIENKRAGGRMRRGSRGSWGRWRLTWRVFKVLSRCTLSCLASCCCCCSPCCCCGSWLLLWGAYLHAAQLFQLVTRLQKYCVRTAGEVRQWQWQGERDREGGVQRNRLCHSALPLLNFTN